MTKSHSPASLSSCLNKDEDNTGRRKGKHLMIAEARVRQGGRFGKGACSLACGKEPSAFAPGRPLRATSSAAPFPLALGRDKANPARGIRLNLGTEHCTIQSSCKLATEHPERCIAMGFTDECMNMLTKTGPAERARAAPQGSASPTPCPGCTATSATRARDMVQVGLAGQWLRMLLQGQGGWLDMGCSGE